MLQSCQYFVLKNEDKKDVIVRVGDEQLSASDLKDLFTGDLTPEDSILLRKNYIEEWTRKQVILRKAKFNLTEEKEQNLEQLINEYREDLYINSYKEALVAQTLDSVINQYEIEQFYISNQDIFRLREPLLQYRLLSVRQGDPLAGKMFKLFTKNDSLSIASLIEDDYSFQLLQLNDSTWTNLEGFYQTYPALETLEEKKLLKKNKYIYFTNDNIDYHIYTNKVLEKDEVAPLEIVAKEIAEMIYHQKKLKFLQELDHKLIKEAIDENIYKSYETN